MAQAKSVGKTLEHTLITIIVILALVICGYAYITLTHVRNQMHSTPSLESTPVPHSPPKDDGAEDILLVGTDARTDAEGHPLPKKVLKALRTENKPGTSTDTIIILRIPKDGSAPQAVSIPRDTWTDIPTGGQNKINSAFERAKLPAMQKLLADGKSQSDAELASDNKGRTALIESVQDLTKIHIDHYAEVSLLGFYLLSQAVGGVEVCLNHKTKDPDSGANFKAGKQMVSGSNALAFVRQRKNLPRGDLDRIVRQQTFLAAALNKVLSAGTLTNSSKMDHLTDAVSRSMVLDEDLDIAAFAEQAKGLATGDVRFSTIPVTNIAGRSADGQSIVTVDKPAVRKFVRDVIKHHGSSDGEGGGSDGEGGGSAPSSGPPCIN